MKTTFQRLVSHRYFALADLLCVSAACVFWEVDPRLSWKPLLVALLPWLLRLAAGRFPFKRTPMDIPLLLFILTAGLGVWTAYDHVSAWAKFWLIISGALLFYALAGQPRENLWTVVGHLTFIGVSLALFFLFTNDWHLHPAKLSLLNRIGLWWMKIRPPTTLEGTHPNNTAGVIGFIFPFIAAMAIRAWQEKRLFSALWVILGSIPLCIAFLMATSRGALISLVVGFGIWALWVMSNLAARTLRQPPVRIFSVALLAALLLILIVGIIYPTDLIRLADTFTKLSSEMSRPLLDQATLELVKDFRFTGAGLNTFPALFSRYILNIPFYYLLNSHNIYLDVALEQSLLGLLAFLLIYLRCLWPVVTQGWNKPAALLAWASLTAILIVSVHGLVDNILYGPNDGPFLFLLPGIACAIMASQTEEKSLFSPLQQFLAQRRVRQALSGAAILLLTGLGILAYGYRDALAAAWYADLGSVRMAQIELVGFPTNGFDQGEHLAELGSIEHYFVESRGYDRQNQTANYRLGLIAMLRRDFPTAVTYLQVAYQTGQNHRGIVKSLGYSLAWTGQYDQAAALLKTIPEAPQELSTFSWWWAQQNRPDLAQDAAIMVKKLGQP